VRRSFPLLTALFCLACAAASAEDAHSLPLLSFQAASDVEHPNNFYPTLSYNASLALESADNRSWLKASFAVPDAAATFPHAGIFFEFDHATVVPPLDFRGIPDGSAAWPNVWLGWDRFAFDYRNLDAEPIVATVLIQDWVSWLNQKYDGLTGVPDGLPQMYEQEVTLAPGSGTVTIDLAKRPLWTNTGTKGLDLEDIRAFGLCVKSPKRAATVLLDGFRLEGGRPDAGVMDCLVLRKTCGACGRRFSDVYAPNCVFCGAEIADHQHLPDEFPTFPASATVLGATAIGGGFTSRGAGAPTLDQRATWKTIHIAHYDIHYGRDKGGRPIPRRGPPVWEWRYFLRFSLGEDFAAKPTVRKAALWLFPPVGADELSPKPWNPGLALFAVDSSYNDWDPTRMCWLAMPPYERLIFLSGQHPSTSSQVVSRKVSETCTRWMPFDITEHVQAVITRGERSFTLGLKAFTPFAARTNPHVYGHCFLAGGTAPANERSPKLVIERE
jgi:hypothetical protein